MILYYIILNEIGTQCLYQINLYSIISFALLNVCKLRLFYIGITHILTGLDSFQKC